MHHPDEEHDLDRRHDPAEEVRGRGRGGNRPQQRVPEDKAKPLGDVEVDPPVAAFGYGRRRLSSSDAANGDRRDEEAPGIDGDRVRGADGLDEAAGEARARHLGHLGAAGQLGVALDEMLAAHERGQIRLVGDVEEHGEHARDQRDEIELEQSEVAESVGHRNRAEAKQAAHVGRDHDPPPPKAVHPDAGREADEEEGGRRRRSEGPHLEGGRVQGTHGEERGGEDAHLAAELADRLATPQQPEVTVTQQRSASHSRTLAKA